MSGATTPLPKTMSSRLLTMKFMQRAAASSTASSPTASSPQNSDVPSQKRRKTDHGSTPTKFDVDALADQRAIQAALASEETKRQIALDRQAAEAGDTRWTLSFEEQSRVGSTKAREVPIRVVEMGWSGIDSPSGKQSFVTEDLEAESEDEERPIIVGRRSFGKFNKVVEKTQDDDESSSEDDSESKSDSDADSDSSLDPNDPTSQLIKAERDAAVAKLRAERKNKRKAERATSDKLARERQKREVNLNGMMSLTGRQDVRPDIKCFKCGGPHRKDDCPQRKGEGKRRFEGGGDEGPRRKAQKSR